MEPTTTTPTTTPPATTGTIAGDPRPQFVSATDTLRAVVAGLEPDQMDRPTPCGMTVREVVDHVGMAVGRATAAGCGLPMEEWPAEGFSVGDDIVAGLDRLVAEATTAWSDGRLTEQVEMPWTVMDGAGVLATYVNEVLVHAWDLATATNQEIAADDDAVAVAEALIRRELPDPERGPMWEAFKQEMPEGIPFDPPFADAVPVAGDATPIVRLVAWNGRQP